MKEGGGALALALKEGVRGTGFAVLAKKDLGAGHLPGLHTGFGLELSVGGVEKPIALGQALSNGPFGGFSIFFVEIEAAAVSLVRLAKLASVDGFIGAIEKKLDAAGLGGAGTEDDLALEVTVGAGLQNMGGDKGGFVIIPDRVTGGLVGWVGKLVGLIDRTANGICRLQALENDIEDEADLRLGQSRRGRKESEERED